MQGGAYAMNAIRKTDLESWNYATKDYASVVDEGGNAPRMEWQSLKVLSKG
jgi:hypothetical protein